MDYVKDQYIKVYASDKLVKSQFYLLYYQCNCLNCKKIGDGTFAADRKVGYNERACWQRR